MVNSNIKRLWQGFWQLADPKIWVASTVPMLVGAALAYRATGEFNIIWFTLSLIGVYLIEIGKNSSNEYIDYLSGVDVNIAPENRNPFSGGKKTIVYGKLTLNEVKYISLFTFLGACGIGLLIIVFREPRVFWVGILGLFLAVFYSLPPFKFAYMGLGELAVGFTYGPLIVLGMYLVIAKSIDYRILIVGLPIGLLITNILWINQYPDYEADLGGKKRNWLVRLGKERGINIYKTLFVLAYVSFVPLSIVLRSPYWLLSCISIPLAAKAVSIAQQEYDNIPKLLKANVYTLIIYQLTGAFMVIASLYS